jgi:hypothetical protein
MLASESSARANGTCSARDSNPVNDDPEYCAMRPFSMVEQAF